MHTPFYILLLNLILISFTSATQRSDSDTPLVDDGETGINACNYQTNNFTLYHLNDINNVDGGSGSQQIVV